MATRYNFQILDQNNWRNVKVEVAPKIIETQDETFDTCNCVLEANNEKSPYKPMTPFRVSATYDDNSTENFDFYINADNVQVYSTTPLLYKHNLTLIQSSQRTNKLLVRNSVLPNHMVWDKKGNDLRIYNNWAPSSLKGFLNNEYYNSLDKAAEYGLKKSANSMIDEVFYNLGGIEISGDIISTEALSAAVTSRLTPRRKRISIYN